MDNKQNKLLLDISSAILNIENYFLKIEIQNLSI